MALTQLADEVARLPDLAGVEPVGRLVEDEEFRLVDEGVGESHALAVAFREGADDLALDGGEAAGIHRLVHRGLRLAVDEPLEPGAEAEVFPDAQVGIERHVFRHVADAPTDLDGVLVDVVSRHRRGALGRGEEAGEHAQGRALARAVRPEETDDLPLSHLEGNGVDGGAAGVAFGEVSGFDHGTADSPDTSISVFSAVQSRCSTCNCGFGWAASRSIRWTQTLWTRPRRKRITTVKVPP